MAIGIAEVREREKRQKERRKRDRKKKLKKIYRWRDKDTGGKTEKGKDNRDDKKREGGGKTNRIKMAWQRDIDKL
jgi:hypothetical protein